MNLFKQEVVPGPVNSVKPSASIRLVSFNVHYAKNPYKIAEAIKEHADLSHADVILLQEVEYHLHEGKGRADQIAEFLGYECIYAPASTRGSRGTHGLAVLTKLPVLETEVVQLPFFKLGFRSRRRIALRVVLDTPQGPVQVYNVHLDTRINIQHRLQQLSAVMENFHTKAKLPTVIAGDLNTIQATFIARSIPIFFANQRAAVSRFLQGHGYISERIRGYTMKQGLVRFNLDGIFANGLQISTIAVERNVQVSDHAPIWADLYA
jgi:endonuclease/exonuclease/phosphatase family metal-dependent hydrolase